MRTHHLLQILTLIAFVAGLLVMPWWTVDDAYISYRYGANFAKAGEMVWNLGSDPVEGYTGLVLPILAAICIKLGIPLLASIKILGILASIGTAWTIYQALLRLKASKAAAATGSLLYGLSPIVYVHALSGLETSLFVFLGFYLFITILFLESEPSKTKQISLGLLSGLCIMLRPEGLLWIILVLAASFFMQGKPSLKIIKSKLVFLILIVLSTTTLYVTWRLWYYGELLPNTYYAKQYPGAFNLESLKAAARFGAYYLGIPFLAVALAALISKSKLPINRSYKTVFICAAAIFLFTLLSYTRSQLFMNYGSRFFFPFLPLGLVLAMVPIDKAWQRIQNGEKVRRNSFAILLALLSALYLGLLTWRWKTERTFLQNYQAVMEQEWIPVSKFLSEQVPAGATVILNQDAGIIAYNTDFECIDFGRLNDYYLSHAQPNPEVAADYFFSFEAAAAVFTSFKIDEYDYWDEGEAIHADARFKAYELAKVYGNDRSYPYFQFVYLRKSPSQ